MFNFLSYLKFVNSQIFVDNNKIKLEKLLNTKIFFIIFSDSGSFDYFLLSIFDLIFKLLAVYSLFFYIDNSIVEKASWKFFSFYYWKLNKFLFFENFEIKQIFLVIYIYITIFIFITHLLFFFV